MPVLSLFTHILGTRQPRLQDIVPLRIAFVYDGKVNPHCGPGEYVENVRVVILASIFPVIHHTGNT